MMLDNPRHIPAHKGADHLGRHAVMVLRGQTIADVMQKRAHDPVDIGPIAHRTRRRLQPVGQPRDLVALKRHLIRAAQFVQDTIGREGEKGFLEPRKKRVFLARVLSEQNHLRRAGRFRSLPR
jgi:hypothetical protein